MLFVLKSLEAMPDANGRNRQLKYHNPNIAIP